MRQTFFTTSKQIDINLSVKLITTFLYTTRLNSQRGNGCKSILLHWKTANTYTLLYVSFNVDASVVAYSNCHCSPAFFFVLDILFALLERAVLLAFHLCYFILDVSVRFFLFRLASWVGCELFDFIGSLYLFFSSTLTMF